MQQHITRFSEYDIALFKAGVHYELYNKLGAYIMDANGTTGTYFAVWAPNAKNVSLTGNFNGWNKDSHRMNVRWDSSGIWELFVPGIGQGEYYKYAITGPDGRVVEKSDPYATHCETSPGTASVVWDRQYKWTDKKWMNERQRKPQMQKPVTIYEVHLGSWRRKDGRSLSYRELSEELPAYCVYMGFTHVELMPIMEHPFYGSWGYQATGYYAPTSRYGVPQDLMHLINELHKAGIGVLLDWVPSHFPDDEHGLGNFDGTHLYEHEDPQKGFHPDWHSYIFNMARNEVRSFLISSALYWLREYHMDGLRVDAVASMLYLDYSRRPGEWSPNEYGGRENLEAVAYIKQFNDAVHTHCPDVITIAEESTAWPGVTRPTNEGGLGFDMKWMMGWMNDTLTYMQKAPIYRSHHHDALTFNIYYAYSEKFLLPLSHDEVVHGKYSLLKKMPGDEWQQFANLRLLYGYMYGHPGSKLIFMGGEFAQAHEWRHDHSLDWHENEHPMNRGVQALVRDLNALCRLPEMYEQNFSPTGYEWLHFDDRENSVISWMRKTSNGSIIIFVCNFTPVVRRNYRIGIPMPGHYKEVLNTDDIRYGGSGIRNSDLEAFPIARHGRTHSLSLVLPPLGVIVLRPTGSNF
ncbi:1,4-alpha-glucan branching protein GlgB [Nemorincola caseinilytica]